MIWGLRGNLPKFIKNFLSDRVFQVLLGTTLSGFYTQEEGVPQGAILSITLFNVKLNNIVKIIAPGVDCSLYVDDFVILFRSSTIAAIERKLQMTINDIIQWTLKNGFTVSPNKTVAMHFCLKRKCYDPVLKLGNVQIEFVKEFKFLGLIWDTKLTFKNHIAYLRKKCQKSLNLLKVLSHTDWGADSDTLLKLYRSLVRSKLDYGSIVYGSANKTDLQKVDVTHNQGLRLSLGAFKSSPVESLYVEAGEQPLELRRRRLSLQYGLKIKANPDNAAYNAVYKPKHPELYEDDGITDTFGIDIKKELRKASIKTRNIMKTFISDVPTWDLDEVPVCFDLTQYNNSTPSEVFISKFRKVQRN